MVIDLPYLDTLYDPGSRFPEYKVPLHVLHVGPGDLLIHILPPSTLGAEGLSTATASPPAFPSLSASRLAPIPLSDFDSAPDPVDGNEDWDPALIQRILQNPGWLTSLLAEALPPPPPLAPQPHTSTDPPPSASQNESQVLNVGGSEVSQPSSSSTAAVAASQPPICLRARHPNAVQSRRPGPRGMRDPVRSL